MKPTAFLLLEREICLGYLLSNACVNPFAAMKANKLKLKLIGGFKLVNHQGVTIDIASKKGRLLLAMLVVSEAGERTRIWLQEKLWSRGSGQDSLRRELASLRKLFDQHGIKPLPKSVPRDVVRLDFDCFEADVLQRPGIQGSFLDGLSIPQDEPVEKWLAEMRSKYSKRLSQPKSELEDTLSAPYVACDTDSNSVARVGVAVHPIAWRISDRLENKLQPFVIDTVGRIGRVLLNSGGIDVIDLSINAMMPDMTRIPTLCGITAELIVSVDETYSGTFLKVQVLESKSSRVLSSSRCEIGIGPNGCASTPEFIARRFVSDSADEILSTIVRLDQSISNDAASVMRLIHEGVEGMFCLSSAGLDKARANLDLAIEQQSESVAHAWRAYLCNLLIDMRLGDVYELKSEAREHATKALELDRFNPLTRSLLTHVYSFALQEFEIAAEHISVAKELQSDHLMTHDSDALLQLYQGNLDQSRRGALQASKIGRLLPYRFLFLTSLCMVESRAGNFEQSITIGEHALRSHPSNTDRVYLPCVRYLSESYARNGDQSKATALVESLKANDKLSLEALARRGRPTQDIDTFLQTSVKMLQ